MANIAFRELDLAQSRQRVRRVEEFAQQIAGGGSLTAIAQTNNINVHHLSGAVNACNNYTTKIDEIRAKRVANKVPRHLNHLKAFTEQQQKDIKEEAIAKAMMFGGDIGKILLKVEQAIEDAISNAIDYQLVANGVWPKFNDDGSIEILY